MQMRPSILVSLAGFVTFALLTVAVHLGQVADADLQITRTIQRWHSPLLDAWATAGSLVGSGEISLLFSLVASVMLRRAGLGRWSLVPLVFLLLVPAEILLKLTIRQPLVPEEFYRPLWYPFASAGFGGGAFPSGHATRVGFFCAFAALLAREWGGTRGRLAPVGIGILGVLIAPTRVYAGWHWASDVVDGLILGFSVALLVAPPVARRLRVGSRKPAVRAAMRERPPGNPLDDGWIPLAASAPGPTPEAPTTSTVKRSELGDVR